MREILFRGIDVRSGRWVYGNLHHEWIGVDMGYIIYPVSDEPCVIIESHIVKPNSIGQYTGLTDKKGKRIFDGDIVHYQCSDVTAEVKIGEYRDADSHKDAYGCYVEYVEDDQIVQEVMNHMESNKTYGCEVIGNIHDNPELLEDNP